MESIAVFRGVEHELDFSVAESLGRRWIGAELVEDDLKASRFRFLD